MKKIYLSILIFLISIVTGFSQGEILFSMYYTGNCGPLTVSFSNDSYFMTGDTVGPVTYEWYINGMLASTEETLADSLFQPGYYSIELKAYDDGILWGSDWQDIQIDGFSGNVHTWPENPCPGEDVEIFISDPHQWVVWKFLNTGEIFKYNNIHYTFDTAGTYPVKVNVMTDECGLDSVTTDIVISNTAIPPAEIWINGSSFCPYDEIKFSAPDADAYEWKIEGNTFTTRDVFYAFDTVGIYNVYLTTWNACGNSNSDTAEVYINSTYFADASFDIRYSYVCPGTVVEFEAWGSGSYEWDLGDGKIAHERIAKNIYKDTGTYQIRLVVNNGCGNSDTSYQELVVYLDPFQKPGAQIQFENFEDWIDTIYVCPNTEVSIKNYSWGENLKYTWMIDTNVFHSKDLIYSFSNQDLNEVMMIARNNCGGADTAYKYVWVDPTLQTTAQLNVAPFEICPGEMVYFWNEEGDDQDLREQGIYKQQLTFDIDFGDGNSMNGITGPTHFQPEVLAAHIYDTIGNYPFIFVARNGCNNTDTLQGEIIVADDATKQPFYYVDNSTAEGKEKMFEDWSKPRPGVHEFVIGVDLLNWNYMVPMDSLAYLFFWHGEIDPNGDPGPPQGFMRVNAPDTVHAYIPYDPLTQSVGIAAVWYCNQEDFDNDPQVYALPIDKQTFDMVQSFPIELEGFTDLTADTTLQGPITLDGMMWEEGYCPPPSYFNDRWIYQTSDGLYVVLGIWEDDYDLRYDLGYGPDPWDLTMISSGTVYLSGDTAMQFYGDEMDPCGMETGDYQVSLSEDKNEMQFFETWEDCTNRLTALEGGIFKREKDDYDKDNDRTGCPGDSIGFYIVGGSSYEWHFSDGTISYDAFTTHAYADTGTYVEYVVATNNCGRTDTLYTKVVIDTTNLPNFNWWTDKWDIRRYEDVQFMVDDWSDEYGNNSYLWDFGDGNTSTEKNPVHMFTQEGEYEINLTVKNGCGTNTQTNYLWVMKEIVSCQAKFTHEVDSTTVYFYNNSTGENLEYLWEFGNGKISNKANPVHTYAKEGVYEVRLSIQDTVDVCNDEVYMIVQVGTIDCFADFTFNINNTSNSVLFTDKSTGTLDSWFWEFGDGTFSTEQNPVHDYQRAGVYLVCLSVKDSAGTGCVSQACREIKVGEMNVYAEFTDNINHQDTLVQFFDNSEGEITNWYWEFGDGMYDTVPDPFHKYPAPGNYPVCLSVYNFAYDAFDTRCKDIYIMEDTSATVLKADFSFFIDTTTNTVSFTDKSTGDMTNWYWTFGDGNYTTDQNPEHQFTLPGFYEVCLTIYDAATNKRESKCKTLQVGKLACNVTADFDHYINPNTREVSFTDLSTGTVHKWFWDFGDEMTTAKQNPKHMYEKPGFYLVSLAVRDTVNDCTDYFADFIQVGSADCKADFTFSVDAASKMVEFENKSFGTITENFWSFDDGDFATEKHPSHTYGSEGLYYVSLTVKDESGICMDNINKKVQVGSVSCDASFTVYVDSATNVAYFTNSKVGDATELYWSFGDGGTSVVKDPQHKYFAPGYYTVELTTYNGNTDCMDNYEKTILIGNNLDDVEADFIYQSDLSTREVKFFNESKGENLTYLWNFGDRTTSTSENPAHTYQDGSYKFVCLTAYGKDNVQSTVCKDIKVSDDAATNCYADFKFTIDSASKTVRFTDLSNGDPDSWNWDFDDSNTSTSQSPSHTYDTAGYYMVGLTITNASGCESEYYEYINVSKGNNGIKVSFKSEVDTTETTKAGGRPTDFIGTRHGGGSKVSWDFGDGTKNIANSVDTTTLRPRHEYAEPGNYNVCLTISDPLINQSDTYCDSVHIEGETTGVFDPVQTNIDMKVFPNPMNAYTNIYYTIENTANVEIAVFDIVGNRVTTLINTYKPAGEHHIIWRDNHLSNGVYYVRISAGNTTFTQKLLIQR